MAENQSFCVLSSLVFKYSSATPGFIVFFFALITFVKLRAAADKFVYLLLIESWTEKFDRVAWRNKTLNAYVIPCTHNAVAYVTSFISSGETIKRIYPAIVARCLLNNAMQLMPALLPAVIFVI